MHKNRDLIKRKIWNTSLFILLIIYYTESKSIYQSFKLKSFKNRQEIFTCKKNLISIKIISCSKIAENYLETTYLFYAYQSLFQHNIRIQTSITGILQHIPRRIKLCSSFFQYFTDNISFILSGDKEPCMQCFYQWLTCQSDTVLPVIGIHTDRIGFGTKQQTLLARKDRGGMTIRSDSQLR